VTPGRMPADRLVLCIFSALVVAPWAILLFYTKHEEGCRASAAEAAFLYSPVLHAALVLAYAGPPWFTLAAMSHAAHAKMGGIEALAHRRLQWIICTRLLPTWIWLYAFLYNYRHDDVAVFVAGLMLGLTCIECKLVGCSGGGGFAMAVQMVGAVGLVAVSAEDARLCGERVL